MRAWAVAAALLLAPAVGRAASVDELVRAYPEALSGFDGQALIWRDGTRMPVADGQPASILDQLALPYPAGAPASPPADDPGRTRNQAFFDKMYGVCGAGQVSPKLVRVAWLGHSVSVTSVNGVDRQLAAVAREVEALPAEDRKYLFPIGGTYNCRAIAGTDRTSMHSWGAAIDINTRYSDYWRWNRGGEDGIPYRNRIPLEIVAAFERHGFVWGGRWSHFDTMHFEYRPELVGSGLE